VLFQCSKSTRSPEVGKKVGRRKTEGNNEVKKLEGKANLMLRKWPRLRQEEVSSKFGKSIWEGEAMRSG